MLLTLRSEEIEAFDQVHRFKNLTYMSPYTYDITFTFYGSFATFKVKLFRGIPQVTRESSDTNHRTQPKYGAHHKIRFCLKIRYRRMTNKSRWRFRTIDDRYRRTNRRRIARAHFLASAGEIWAPPRSTTCGDALIIATGTGRCRFVGYESHWLRVAVLSHGLYLQTNWGAFQAVPTEADGEKRQWRRR